MDGYRDKIFAFLKKAQTRPIFVFDTETTGIPGKDPVVDIIEFSCIKVEKVDNVFKITDTLDIFINPDYPIPEHILEFNRKNDTGITQEKITNEGLTQMEAVKKISAFWGHQPLLMGYNSVSFDEPLVNELYLKTVGIPFVASGHLDVLRMCKEKFPSPTKGAKISHKLSDMVERLNCGSDIGFHEAIEDVKATYAVFRNVLPLYKTAENPDEPYLSIDNFNVIKVSPWKQSYQMRRIYVANTTGAKIYYDVYNRLWVIPGHLPEDEVIPQIYRKIGVENEREFDEWAYEQCK